MSISIKSSLQHVPEIENLIILNYIFDQIYNRKNVFRFIAELNVRWLHMN